MKLHRKQDQNKSGIYIIRNTINGKFYVGKSRNIYSRIKWHITACNTKLKDENRHLIHSWHKYGKEVFEYKVLEYCELDDEVLAERELYWMRELDAINKGYNFRLDTETKCVMSEDTRRKMSESKLEYYKNPENRAKSSHTFWRDNPEAKIEMGKAVSKAATRFSIEQWSKSGELIKVWDSVKEVVKNNDGYKWQNIYSVCNGYKPSYKGYIWNKRPKN